MFLHHPWNVIKMEMENDLTEKEYSFACLTWYEYPNIWSLRRYCDRNFKILISEFMLHRLCVCQKSYNVT